jgi:hypothetical protein
MLDYKKFAQSIAALGEMFDKQMSKGVVDIYYQTLKDLSDQEFDSAINTVAASQTYNKMPLPAQLRETVRPVINPDEEAIFAFDVFMRGKARTGPYVSVIFDDKTIHDVVMAFGGWNDICMIPESDWKYRRKEWLETYKVFRRSPRTDTPMKLIGIIELNNLQNEEWKRFIPEPVRIGDGRRPLLNAEKERVMVTG